jgi:hypothetical protein
MTTDQAHRAAMTAAAVTSVAGAVLVAAPARPARWLGVEDALGLRIIGVSDIALVPGLVVGRPRWPWLAARAACNVAIAGYALTQARGTDTRAGRLYAVSAAMTIATVVDGRAMRTLQAAE